MNFIGHCIKTLHNWSTRYCYRCGGKIMELKQYTSSLINPIFCQCCNIIQNIGSVYTQHTLHILCQVDLISVSFQIGNFVKMKFYEYSNTISCLQGFMHVMCMHPWFFSMGFPHFGHGLVLISIHAVLWALELFFNCHLATVSQFTSLCASSIQFQQNPLILFIYFKGF